jgi:WD domain, G-beta repeat
MNRLADQLSRLMVRLYPRRWRRRYSDELLAVLDEHRSSPRTVANLALGALGTHLDPAYRREGMTMPGPGNPLRTAVAVAGLTAALIAVVGGLLAFDVWNENRTDGALSATAAAGVAVSPDMRLGITAQGTGPGDSCCDLVWRIGAHPKLLAKFPGGAPLAFAPDGQKVATASPAGAAVWSLAAPARPARIATLPGPNTAVGIAYAPRSTMVAIAYPKTVQLWNLANPAAPHKIATIAAAANVPSDCGYCSNLDHIAFSPDGRTLATTAAHHAVSLWDVSTPWAPRPLATAGRDTGPIAALAFSPAGSQLAYLRQNGKLTVLGLTDPAHPVQAAIPGSAATLAQWGNYTLSYSPDGTRLTAVVLLEEDGGGRATCTWNVTTLSQPLPANCRSDHFLIPGAFTFTANRTAIVGPDPRGAHKLSNTLSIWPPLPG